MSTLLTNIGELVTNAPEVSGQPAAGAGLPGGAGSTGGQPPGAGAFAATADAALVIEGDRVAWTGPAAGRRRRTRWWTRAGAPSSRASSTRTRTWCFRAIAARSSPRGWPDCLTRRGDPHHGRGYPLRPRRLSASQLERLAAELLPAGDHDFEFKSGYGLTSRRAAHLRIAGEFTPETTYLGAHVVPPDTDARTYLALVRRRDARRLRAACALDRRVLRAGCLRRRRGPPCCTQARARARLRVHANQLGPDRACDRRRSGAASADHCTHLTDADVDALAVGSTVATLLPGVEFSTRPPTRTPGGCSLRAHGRAGHRLQSRLGLLAHAAGIALAVREMGMTPAEALWAATAGGARRCAVTDVGASLRAAGRSGRARRAELRAPGLSTRRTADRRGLAGLLSPRRAAAARSLSSCTDPGLGIDLMDRHIGQRDFLIDPRLTPGAPAGRRGQIGAIMAPARQPGRSAGGRAGTR